MNNTCRDRRKSSEQGGVGKKLGLQATNQADDGKFILLCIFLIMNNEPMNRTAKTKPNELMH